MTLLFHKFIYKKKKIKYKEKYQKKKETKQKQILVRKIESEMLYVVNVVND